MPRLVSAKTLRKVLGNRAVRKRLAYEDPLWFCLIYLRHYFTYPLAPFHLEMLHLLKTPRYEFIVVMAFRESGKSTVMNMANVLWSILGKPQRRFAVVVSQTQDQAKNHFTNIKDELKLNELLREDFGPFTDDEAEWKKMSLELVYHDSKILSVAREQSIRGVKYESVRPDLIVCDDLEDSSARSDEAGRNELYARFVSEILPLGSAGTRIVVLGNLICGDSLLMRLKDDIDKKRQVGLFRAYPILDRERRILWPGKFPDLEKIKEVWRKFPRVIWAREFLLKLLCVNSEGEEPMPILVYGDFPRMDDTPETETPVFVVQRPLIDAMREFVIPVPSKTDEWPLPILTRADDPRYKYQQANMNLDEAV